jgi:hypothetical protein
MFSDELLGQEGELVKGGRVDGKVSRFKADFPE